MKTIGEVIQLSAAYLEERKIDRPQRTAEDLLSHVLKMKKVDLYLQFDRPLIEEELSSLREILKRSGKGEPFAYVTEVIEFFGCTLQIDPRVLIPRPETELLVEKIAKRIKKGKLWDLCTGSGCIGIALKKALPELEVTLSDLSSEALALAAANAQRNHVAVSFAQGDLFAPFVGQRADFIVCNPPYVSQSEYFALDSSVRDYEPRLALVGGERGTEFYVRIAQEFSSYLNPGGALFLEIGSSQSAAVQQIFGGKGELYKDLSGHPRFFFLEKQ